MYDNLFAPLKIGTLTIRNRVIMSSMGCGTANKDGKVSDRQIAYFTERARGGVGLIITGTTRVNGDTGIMPANQISVECDENIPSIRRLVDSIHEQGAAIFLQLNHPGNQTYPRVIGGQPTVGPSGIPSQLSKAPCRPMTVEEIRSLVNDYAAGAARAKAAGVDGVELHCAHGYLLNQFLSPYTNRRTDEYGGTMEKRAQIVKEIILAVRERVGRDFPVTMRITVEEFLDRSSFPHDNKGITLEEGVALCKYLVPFGLDAVNVTAGTYETMNTSWEPTSYQEGWKLYLAEAVKKEVDVPVFGVGTIRNPAFANSVIAEGRVDAVCIARGNLADPEWCNKAKSGREKEIRRCVSCLFCIDELTSHGGQGMPFRCAVNARAAHEIDFPEFNYNGDGRKVIVVGGGPAGMEAARVLATRGFNTILFEKGARLGGQLYYASKPPHKEKLFWLVEFFEEILPKLGVDIRLNTDVTAEMILAEEPYGVILATGAEPVRPASIPGIFGDNVAMYTDVLDKKIVFENKHIVLVGSGMSGMETATALAVGNNSIDIVEMAEKIGPGVYFQLLDDAKWHLRDCDVHYYPGHKLLSINEQGVVTEFDGEPVSLGADAVVIAMGVRSNKTLEQQLKDKLDKVVPVGDAVRSGRIGDAVPAAFEVAYCFE